MPNSPERPAGDAAAVDYAALYDGHPEYAARREAHSLAVAQIDLEVLHFKLPEFAALLEGQAPCTSVIEIGCATGELIAAFPAAPGARRVGVDISPKNITAAAERFAGVEFLAGDFTALSLGGFDAVVLSDVLEHVPDDVGFLRRAASLGRRVFVNLPLEDNWLNRGRPYGPDDVSGHLRAYSREQGLALMAAAGLVVRRERRVWVHESPADAMRRDLRQRMLGQAYEGAAAQRALKQLVMTAAKAIRPFGRRLLASNLFLMAEPRG